MLSNAGIPGFWDGGGGCPDDAIVAGAKWAADQGARIINLSLGGPGDSPAHLEALRDAVGKGGFVTIAAGKAPNRETRLKALEDGLPQRGRHHGRRSRTVDDARLLLQHLAGHRDCRTGGSERDGGSAGPVTSDGIRESDFDFESVVKPRFDRYTTVAFQGTSMAAPHVAGVAAPLDSQGVTNPAAIRRPSSGSLGTGHGRR